jgi:anti-sigma factor RsiW
VKVCERYLNAIQELVDGTLGPIRRAELELHLESCDACRALAEDLQTIAAAAQSLELLTPPDRTWQQISSRLRAEGRAGSTGPGLVRRQSVAILALAAALVFVVGASLYVLRRQAPVAPNPSPVASTPSATPQSAAGNPATAPPVQAGDIATELAAVDKHFQNVIEQASTKDPATAAILRKNLLVMNEAIAESRKALEADPQNRSAQLYENLKRKIRFLQDTIALMNSMRQGDAAGAAEIVESGKS